MYDFTHGGDFNFYCMDCHENFTKSTKEGDVIEMSGDHLTKCPFCEGMAKIVGRPSPLIKIGENSNLYRQLREHSDDPEKSTKIQEQLIEDRKREVSHGGTKARYLKSQKEAAMKNKAEWVKRGRIASERMEAVKG